MQSKIVLITGCSSGIGRALAQEFFQRNFIVYATARKIETLDKLKQQGMYTLSLDVNDNKNVDEVISHIIQQSGKIDILINNAGYASISPLIDLSADVLENQFQTNVFSPLYLIQKTFPHMKENGGGMIVNIGSISGIFSTPFAGAYCATKAAVHSLSDALRMELAPFNIKVVTVQPGAIRSNFGNRSEKEVTQNVTKKSDYNSIMDAIHQRAQTSQENPTPVDVFAKKLTDELTKQNPKPIIRLGKGSHSLLLLKRLLPEKMLDKILMKKFKLNELNRQ